MRMIHINILSRRDNIFTPHWDKDCYPETIYDIQGNSQEDRVWDCVVVYQNIKHPVKFRCREGRVLYFSGEPPMMAPCPHIFTEQFDTVVLPHPKVRHQNKITSHGYLNWSLGMGYKSQQQRYDYPQLKKLEAEKTKLLSIVSSNQKMMPGHNKRMTIIEKLQQDYPNEINVFGKGFKFLDFKADALLPYRFHICMENSSIPDYWTEKFADPVLAQSLPIYAGCTNIEKYFGSEGYIPFDISDYDSLRKIIDRLLEAPDEEYLKRKPALENLRDILMSKQNLIPFVINFIDNDKHIGNVKEYNLTPLEDSLQFKWQMWGIRAKRYAYKIQYRFNHK